MESLLKSTRRIQSACWLVRLRWAAIAVLGMATFFASRLLDITLPYRKLYIITGVLFFYNFILYDYIKQLTWKGQKPKESKISGMILFQISTDLFILTSILHFSGGIENPFFLFFVFHMIIASILCSKLQSYIQATLAIFLFGSLVILERFGILWHYELKGFAAHGLYNNPKFIFGTLFVFAGTLYLVVYMTTSIIGQLREQQDSFEEANKMLEEKDMVKNEYVLRLTHDIKGHLAAIESCINIVKNEMIGPLNEKQKDMIGRAYRRTGKCMSFITALLKLTKMNLAGKLEEELFELNQIIANAVTVVQNRATQKSITILSDIGKDVYRVYGEPVLIEETLTNILFNAIRYTPGGGRISLTLREQGAEYVVRVRDTGIGIPPGQEEQIFEEFYRASNARKVERDGTGLGLSFAKQAIEKHGGKIWAQNNPDGGATFSFSLPKAQT
ncbi:MAG: HAMP domain-containing histidine kinase [Sedimentisphaerales bacterium]|nr:HAMP domain-containing histidine kinase [Sedimentisphaerales bacterium]